MKVRIVTVAGEQFDLEADDRAVGRLEFHAAGEDPELPSRFWLSEIASVTVSEHPAPILQTAPPPRLVERELDVSSYGFTHRKPGERVRVGPRRTVRVHTPEVEPLPAKPKAKAKR